MSTTTRRVSVMAAQASVSVALLAWLVRGLDTHALGRLLFTLPPRFYLASLGVIVAGQVLYAWRWWLLLSVSGVDVPLGAAIRYYFIGIFANNFLPSTIGGDAAKVFYLGRQHGYRTIVASVVVDRLLGLASLAVLAAAASWLVPAVSARFVVLRLAVTLIAAAACGVIALALVGAGGVQRWAAPLGATVLKQALRLQRLRHEMAWLMRHPRVFAYSAGVVLVYFVSVTLIYVWFLALSGVPGPSVVAVFTAVSMTGVLSNVPISLNGLGVREQLHAWLFMPLGVPQEVAVAISLLLFGHILLTSVGGMVLWVMQPAAAAPGVEVSEAVEPTA